MQLNLPFWLVLLLVGGCESFIPPRLSTLVTFRDGQTVLVERCRSNDNDLNGSFVLPATLSNDDPEACSDRKSVQSRRWWNPFHRRRPKASEIKEEGVSTDAMHSSQQEPKSSTSMMSKFRRMRKRFAQALCIICTLIAVAPIMPGDIAPVHQETMQTRPPIVLVMDRSYATSQALARTTATVTHLEGSRLVTEMVARGSALQTAVDAVNTATIKKDIILQEKKQESRKSNALGVEGIAEDNKPSLIATDRRHAVLSFVTEAVEKVGPAVLRIDTETSLSAVDPTTDFIQQGQGSGVIFSTDGFVVTNAHVVEDASKVTVTLTDGRVFEAKVCGTDEIVDIGMLISTTSSCPPVLHSP